MEGSDSSLTAAELDALLLTLDHDEEAPRRRAAERILASARSSLPVIRQRLTRELRSAPSGLLRLFDSLAPDEPGMSLPPRRDPEELVDVLDLLLGRPRDEDTRREVAEATEVVTLLRALTRAGTSFSVGILIRYGARERGVFKAEIGRDLLRLGEQSLPALIRTTRHPNERIAQFAIDVLEWLRRASAGQQVQVRDPAVLAEILTVFGTTADRSTVPVLLSFSGSENADVRQAARDSVLRYGRAILWPTRTKYSNFVGEDPPRRWGWEQTAQELFAAQDRARQAQVEQEMELALREAAQGRHERMLRQYRAILARWPLYERRHEMVPGLSDYGDDLLIKGENRRARNILREAALLARPGQRSRLEAKLLTIDAALALERGVADRPLLERAHQLTPEAEAPQRLLAYVDERIQQPDPRTYRLVATVGILIFGLAFLGLLVVRVLPPSKATTKESAKKQEESKEKAPSKAAR